jgi:acyl carrier protein
MTEEEIHRRLSGVFQKFFDDPHLEISGSTRAQDVEDWDSITHVDLVVAVEKEFATSFTIKDIRGLSDVGDFIRLIASRVK